MKAFSIHNGDALAVLKTLPNNHFDACLSDPPYGISFMGKEWDKGVPSREVWAELLRVLKPGGYALVFGGTRTFHRLAVNLEDAGFDIKDCLSWLYGSGFPKSHNISKALEKNGLAGDVAKGYGTALKPAWEPCLLVQKPLDGTYANNVAAHGCGALNIDGCRIGRAEDDRTEYGVDGDEGPASVGTVTGERARVAYVPDPAGRFPANLILGEASAAALDEKTDNASRFFYTAKVSTCERNAGVVSKNSHPTLKPLALAEYLAKLLLPAARTDGQPRRIVVPFSGAGSEMIGCLLAGWDHVEGIELDPEYVATAFSRISHHTISLHVE